MIKGEFLHDCFYGICYISLTYGMVRIRYFSKVIWHNGDGERQKEHAS